MKQTLVEIFSEIGNFSGVDLGGNDKNSFHSYLPVYDKLFAPFRTGCDFMEIGIAMGDSIRLWDRYFEKSKIIGVDLSIVFEPKQYTNDVTLIEADATTPYFLDRLKYYTAFDIIVEDSSHQTLDQIAIFNSLKHKMKKNGLYIIEDCLALDQEREKYLALHPNCEIIDLRHVKGRFDDCLILFRF